MTDAKPLTEREVREWYISSSRETVNDVRWSNAAMRRALATIEAKETEIKKLQETAKLKAKLTQESKHD